MGTQGQTEHRKTVFLATFRVSGNISAACRAARFARPRVYEWLQDDEAFAIAFHEAELESLECLEGEAFRRAVKGVLQTKPIFHEGQQVGEERVRKYSDVLLIFLLKARAPEKYRERLDVHQSAGTEGPAGDQLAPEERARLRAWLTTARTAAESGTPPRDGGESSSQPT